MHAKEERTGLEQHVEVKPSYGLDDDTVEQMLIDAIDSEHLVGSEKSVQGGSGKERMASGA